MREATVCVANGELAMLFRMMVLVGLLGAMGGPLAKAADLGLAVSEAEVIVARALENPETRQTDVAWALARIQAHLPQQDYTAIARGTPEYESRCFERDSQQRIVKEHFAFAPMVTCLGRVAQGQVWNRCELVFCPRALAGSQASLVHAVIHEVGHATGLVDECKATYAAMMAQRLAGLKPVSDIYVSGCGLGWLAE